ncbi:SulA-like leucine-rich domain-containing protein [Rheinheimera fenheensis]|uniref:SulA-like leucine-rich domain-containing protein n=1 Tax=Rheinheimera fenheensis TaxID=3152295 RepID=UPI00325C901F
MYNHQSGISLINTAESLATLSKPSQASYLAGSTGADHTQDNLLALLKRYENSQGWILLIAPNNLPNKSWLARYQLPLNKILVIHEKQISDLNVTVARALSSGTCQLVVNFAKTLCPVTLQRFQQQAKANNVHLYQAEQLSTMTLAH